MGLTICSTYWAPQITLCQKLNNGYGTYHMNFWVIKRLDPSYICWVKLQMSHDSVLYTLWSVPDIPSMACLRNSRICANLEYNHSQKQIRILVRKKRRRRRKGISMFITVSANRKVKHQSLSDPRRKVWETQFTHK